MRRRHGYARRQVHAAFWRYLRRNAGLLLGIFVMMAVFAVPTVLYFDGWFEGFFVGVMLCLYLGMLLSNFVGVTASTNQIVGSWGEDATRDELRKAKRRRLIAGWIDNVEIEGGDVDHLVILRDGRHLSIDSKWHGVHLDDDLLARDARSGASNARRASLVLRSLKLDPNVVPLVVCWGGVQSDLQGSPRTVDGIEIIGGRDLRRWLGALPRADYDRTEVRRQLAALESFRDRVRPDLSRAPRTTRAAT